MSDSWEAIDVNSRGSLTAVSNVDGKTIVRLWADPVTHRLLVDSSGGSGSISVTDGSTTVTSVTTIDFTAGATVTDGGGGTANVQITGGGGGTLTKEVPSGIIDGVNTVFTTVHSPSAAILNGAVQDPGVDYTVSGAYTITFVQAPVSGSLLFIFYGGSGSGGTGTWYTVSGTINGANTTFTIPVSPASDFMLFLARQPQMKTTDYTVSGSTITYASAPDASLSGQPHTAFVIS